MWKLLGFCLHIIWNSLFSLSFEHHETYYRLLERSWREESNGVKGEGVRRVFVENVVGGILFRYLARPSGGDSDLRNWVSVKSSTQPGVKPIRRRLVVKARHSGAEYGVTDTEGVVGSSGARRRTQPLRWFHRLQSCLTSEFRVSARH